MIHPVILCGGSGTRLWPLSRRDFPKQFTRLLGEESLFQDCVRRFAGSGFAAPLVLSHVDFRLTVLEQLSGFWQGLDASLRPAWRFPMTSQVSQPRLKGFHFPRSIISCAIWA